MKTNRGGIMNRTIQLQIDDERIKHGNFKERDAAIGYLSAWAAHLYPNCCIRNDGTDDLVAVYKNESGEIKYVIGAVWRGDRYSYHS